MIELFSSEFSLIYYFFEGIKMNLSKPLRTEKKLSKLLEDIFIEVSLKFLNYIELIFYFEKS